MKQQNSRRQLRGLGDGSCGPLAPGEVCMGNGVIQITANPVYTDMNRYTCANGQGVSDPSECGALSDAQRAINQAMYDQGPELSQWGWNPSTGPVAPQQAQQTTASTPAAPVIVVPVYHPAVRLDNLTTGNPGVIVAGRDTWRLSISGAAPNALVSVTASKDGGAQSSTNYGSTDAAGTWSMSSSSSSSDIGRWFQTWKAGNDTAGSLAFEIVAAVANLPQQPAAPVIVVPVYHPAVRLDNLTTGNPGVIVAGRDQWRISISGAAPGAPVSVTASKDAGAPTSASYGHTDAAGNWSMTGSSSPGDAGAWLQAWHAGADPAGTVAFQIVPPISTPTSGSSSTSSSTPASGGPSTVSSGGPSTVSSGGPSTVSSGGGLIDSAKDALNQVQAAAADIPSVWIWAGAIGAVVLLMHTGRKK